MTAAATELGYSASAVSQAMSALERQTATVLFERTSRGASLTEAGDVLAVHAQEIVRRIAAAEGELHALSDGRLGSLRLGWFTTAGGTLVPRAVAALRERYPNIRLGLTECDPHKCVELLRQFDLDVGLVYYFGDPLCEELPLTLLMEDPAYILLPADHPFVEREEVDLAELKCEWWVQRASCHMNVVQEAFDQAGFQPQIAFHTDNPITMQGMVAAGMGIATAPLTSLQTVRRDVVARRLRAGGLDRRVYALQAPGRSRPLAATMVEILRDVASTLQRDSSGQAIATSSATER